METIPKNLADLERESAEISSQIRELTKKLRNINDQISQIRAEEYLSGGTIKINRKNRNKVRVLAIVRQLLLDAHEKYQGRGMSTRELYDRVLASQSDLKYQSFRSYLHRFENEKLIFKVGHGGAWRLTENRGKNA